MLLTEWIWAWLAAGAMAGTAVVLVCQRVSPGYFYVARMGLWNHPRPELRLLLDGLLGGGTLGLLACAWQTAIHWGVPDRVRRHAIYRMAAAWFAGTFLTGGLLAAALTILCPAVVSQAIPLPPVGDAGVRAGWAFAQGALWGCGVGVALYPAASWIAARRRGR